MSRGPSAHELDRLLAELPRERASRGFREQLMTRLDGPPRPRPVRRLLAVVAAAALLVAIALLFRPAPTPDPGNAERWRAEHRSMMAELEALKASLGTEPVPVIYLGGDEQLDLVLDLAPVWGLEPGAAGVVPAAIGDPERPRPRTADQRQGGNRR